MSPVPILVIRIIVIINLVKGFSRIQVPDRYYVVYQVGMV